MKIPTKVQKEIDEAIYLEEVDCAKRAMLEINKDMMILLKGKNLGLSVARQMINAWNEPNHGKHNVQLNGVQK